LRSRISWLLAGRGWKKAPRRDQPSHFDGTNVPRKLLDCWRPIVDADLPDADVVIACWWETAEWVANLSAAKGAKAYFIQHHEVHSYLPKDRTEATYRLPMHKIAIAKWLVDVMRDRYGDADVSYVPNAVDIEQFTAPPRGKQTAPTVGMLYTPARWKGCDVALRAFDLAKQRVPDLRMVAFGSSQPQPRLPLPDGAEFAYQPPQDRIKDFYAKCDAWLFASRLEGFGLPILEAMACRTPVIGTPAGAAPELLEGGAGILVKPEDPNDMANAIERVARMNGEEWRAMSDLAYDRATRYTWDDATDRFEAALRRAIEKSAARR
jgi:glycosyltransferase involved in cell wall biosynthesis